jgi:hypothetical protein
VMLFIRAKGTRTLKLRVNGRHSRREGDGRAEFIGYEAGKDTSESGGAVYDGEEVECCSGSNPDL